MDSQFSNHDTIKNFTSLYSEYNDVKSRLTMQIIHKLFIFDFGTHSLSLLSLGTEKKEFLSFWFLLVLHWKTKPWYWYFWRLYFLDYGHIQGNKTVRL